MASVLGVSATGNAEIDGLLSGTKWTGTVTYSFPDSPSDYPAGYGSGEPLAADFTQAPVAMQQAVTYALGLVSAYTNISIAYAGTNGADIRIAQSSIANPTSYAYYPSATARGEGGDVWFGTVYNYSAAALGNYYFLTAIHELGHALGLKHSQELGGVANVAVPTAHDDLEFSVMSYRSYVGEPVSGYTNEGSGFPQSYMANDILALQTLYGANYATHSENTVYSWSPTTGQEFINGVAQLAPGNGAGGSANRIFETVWDGNGIDTYDMSNYSTGVAINLNPGASSITSPAQLAYLGAAHYAQGNIYNAYLVNGDQRSYIDNAIGGSGNDIIVGNAIANVLTGGGGNDTLTGGGGNDTISGGPGTDVAIYSGNRADYLITYNGSTQNFTLADLRSGAPDGTDTVNTVESFQFADGTYLAAALMNHAPVVAAGDITLASGHAIAATSLFSATDADGDAMSYYFLDGNTDASSGYFVLDGVAEPPGHYFLITAAQLSHLSFVAGAPGSTDSLSVNAFDGTAFGNGASFTFSTAADHAPVVSASNISLANGHSVAATSLFSAADADGDMMTYYFLDGSPDASSGHFVFNGVTQAAGSYFAVTAAQLSQLSFVAGAFGSVDSISVNTFDGIAFGNGASMTVTATADHAPVVSASDMTMASGHSLPASSLFSATDADGDAMSYYFLDASSDASGGHFVFNGVTQAAGSYFTATAAKLAQVSFVAGAVGSVDSISVNTFDGTAFGNGASMNMTATGNHAPVVTASDVNMASGHSLSASSLFSATDADNDTMGYYFLDGSSDASSGHFVFNGVTQAAGSYFTASAAQLSQVSFVAGAIGSVDNLSVNTFDGSAFGNGASFHVSATVNHAPVVTAADLSVASGQSIAASSLFTATDADRDTLTYYFLDGTAGAGSGHFTFNGVPQAAGSYFAATAAQLSHVSFVAGAAGSIDSISVNTFDGSTFGNGASLHLTATAAPGADWILS